MGTAQATAPPEPRIADHPDQSATGRARWWQWPLVLGVVGHTLWWAALPPLGLAPLAFLAPVSWIVLVRQRELAGRRPYLALWFSSFLFWLAALYWLTLPHWATTFGWLALALYLAFYFPAFVGLSRVAVHACGISPIVAAPVVWCGLELVRAHLLSGFAMASLSHTQYRWTDMVQISDLFGAYGVSFLIVLVGACLARMLPTREARRAWWPALAAAAALAAVLAYGHFRTHEETGEAGPRVVLIQGSIDIELKYDRSQAQRIFDEYFQLSRRAVRENPDLDLIVWPETMFRDPWYEFDDGVEPPADAGRTAAEVLADSRRAIQLTVTPLGVPCLLGIDTMHIKRDGYDHYNTALWVDRDGAVRGRYDKCHLVAFGEFVPLAETFPWLYRLTPLPSGTKAGTGPQSFQIGQARYATNICYENTISHLIRSQVDQLRTEDREPDILVNLTNDGWFWGSSELDLHLACAVFRAVECRKPFLVAANTGFSAWIDSNGQVRARGPRRAADVVMARTTLDHRGSWYLDHGDLPAGGCLAACAVLAVVGIGRSRRAAKTRDSAID